MYQWQVVIEGNLVRDPEKVLVGSNGRVMGKFSIAVNRYFKRANAEPMEEVMYIGVQVWGGLAEGCLNYLKKGRGVRVVGRLRQERWEDKEGGNREKIIVVAEHVEFKSEKKDKSDVMPEMEEENLLDEDIAF